MKKQKPDHVINHQVPMYQGDTVVYVNDRKVERMSSLGWSKTKPKAAKLEKGTEKPK